MMTPERSVERLTLYRRILEQLAKEQVESIHSHDLAALATCTAAQVRRDLMAIGYEGSPKRGYEVAPLAESISHLLDEPGGQRVVLVGAGNLGRAFLAYVAGKHTNLSIIAVFDNDPAKTNRVIHGCRCYPMTELDSVLEKENAHVGVIAVPAPDAQEVASRLCSLGVTGLLNFAPVRLQVPTGVFIENVDLTMALEKVAFFSRKKR